MHCVAVHCAERGTKYGKTCTFGFSVPGYVTVCNIVNGEDNVVVVTYYSSFFKVHTLDGTQKKQLDLQKNK